eukprot:jgi/Chrzof1/7232/Cz02g15190.t1
MGSTQQHTTVLPATAPGQSAQPSRPSMSAASQPGQQQQGQYLNEGLFVWMERRREWTRRAGDAKRPSRKRSLAQSLTPDQVLSFQPFPKPVPLEDVVEVLVDVWESEDFFS